MNDVELNAILYYADFLSMQDRSIPVTDVCTYFFIHNSPIHSIYLTGGKIFYDEQDYYFQQSLKEYLIIRDKFGEDGVSSFIDNICSLKAVGKVNGEHMLKYIHQYSQKKDRKAAYRIYEQFKKQIKYKIPTINEENGEQEYIECSKYIAHQDASAICERPEISSSK